MRGLFCNRCGKQIDDKSIAFHGDVYPMTMGCALRGEEGLFDYAGVDLCPSCMRAEVDRINADYKFPPVSLSRDKTRYVTL